MNIELKKQESTIYDMGYRVMVDCEHVGNVYRYRRPNHRKSGRIIYDTTYADKWFAEVRDPRLGLRRVGSEYDTRKRAVSELVEYVTETWK